MSPNHLLTVYGVFVLLVLAGSILIASWAMFDLPLPFADPAAWHDLTVADNAVLAERLAVWPRLCDLLAHEAATLGGGLQLVVDPDSRLTQLGLLLKSADAGGVLTRPATWLYMTGQSQTAGYARTYATVFARPVEQARGAALYDGYLYSGAPPWQVPRQYYDMYPLDEIVLPIIRRVRRGGRSKHPR